MKEQPLFMVLIMVFISAVFTSCSNVDEPLSEPMPIDEGTTYEVSLNLAGEYIDITEEPLGRAGEDGPRKYYGINVYCMKTDGTEKNYTRYAYGVFDNVAEMKISLLGGYKYKFECTSVTEDTDRLHIEDNKLGLPFVTFYNSYYGTYTGFKISELNNFIISQNINLVRIMNGESFIEYGAMDEDGYIPTERSSYPRMDRYYGELEEFDPANGTTAIIPMKRTAFGIKMVVNGVPDGSLSWRSYSLFDSVVYTGSDKLESSQIYTFQDVYDCWKSDDGYYQSFTINFTWIRSNGYEQYFNETITVKRNVMTTVTVNLKGGANDVAIGVNEDNTPMTNEEINVEYDGGNLNDIPVNPEE